jgi:DNA topoisomerase-1
MSKTLVIVESPAKVKTINKFLGKNYIVKSSIGHIRDLAKMASTGKAKSGKKPKKSTLTPAQKEKQEREKLVIQMGVNPYDNWTATYAILPGKEKVLQSLQDAAQKVDEIYLATDIDREGEAIAWHLMESIGGDKARYKRVTFTEITKKAIQQAFLSPTKLNYDRVNAQQARRFLDRVVGYMLSPLLWEKIARGLSAGRVQSVAVRLIAERERSIHAFKPDEYWEIRSKLMGGSKESFLAELVKFNGENISVKNQKEADKVVEVLSKNPYSITQIERKPTSTKPTAPFITSTLQQAASVRLGFGVKKTMMLAQRLYENGMITYMRTDSTNLSEDAVTSCRKYIKDTYGDKYLPPEPNKYSSKKSAQEAHEAIRPTDVSLKASSIAEVEADIIRLYDLIWRQFVACQMNPALFDSTAVNIQCGAYELRARGRVMKFDGFLKIHPQKKSEEDGSLPALQDKEILKLQEVLPTQHFTKPPARFSEASLVRELEKRGIGRPSTYASIISTIQERGYVKVEKRRFFCLKMGELVTDRLTENFSDLMDFSFTANMEEELDSIARGEADWHKVLDTFFKGFSERLKLAEKEMQGNVPTLIPEIKCPICSRDMNLRVARTGVFLSCTGYALPVKERCKGTLNLISGDEMEAYGDEDSDEGNVEELRNKKNCPKCDTFMDAFFIDETRKIHICGNYPNCDGTVVEFGKFRVKGYDGPSIECNKCKSSMILKSGRFGKYFACTNQECGNTRKILKNGEAAPPSATPVHMPELKCEKSSGYFILRDGAAGVFLASSEFPKSKETKRPTVSDLKRHRSELDPKYVFLADAPEFDPEGNHAIIRFSRKSKQHYVMSEVHEKPTGWVASFKDQKWQEKALEE